MENKEITKLLKLTSSLMDLHGENSFKANSYSIASFRLEKIQENLSEMSVSELENLEGIGKSMAAKVFELNQNGSFAQLDDLLETTPEGIMKMMEISGIGPKKIGVLWRELGVENLDELLEACKQGKVAEIKGFGTKVQDNIIKGINYLKEKQGFYRIDQVKEPLLVLQEELRQLLNGLHIETAGSVRRSLEVVSEAELVVATEDRLQVFDAMEKLCKKGLVQESEQDSGLFAWRGKLLAVDCDLTLWICNPSNLGNALVKHTGSDAHLDLVWKDGQNMHQLLSDHSFGSESEVYDFLGKPYIDPELREGIFEPLVIKDNAIPELVKDSDLVGILHNHSNYSDGRNTLREMATGCRDMGMQYLGISDHSQTAVYANGLSPDRVKEQHVEIDELNKELTPFRIFKGIESDILDTGALDYEPETLASFDFVVASIHAQMNMDIVKATDRVIKAVSNPYTTILGHPTGRLLLRRDGYPIDHKEVIKACAEHKVIIEINAHPMRLDLDWRWVYEAQEQGVMISINPDAHAVEQYRLMYYGVGIGRKAGLRKENTFNSWGLDKVSAYFEERKNKIKK